MATKKADTKPKAEVKVEVPEVKPVEKPKAKVYKFISENKYLTCTSLGIQFDNGVAVTTNLAVAKALSKLDGVKRVEE